MMTQYQRALDGRALGLALALHMAAVVAALGMTPVPKSMVMVPALMVRLHVDETATESVAQASMPVPLPRSDARPVMRPMAAPVLAAPEPVQAAETVVPPLQAAPEPTPQPRQVPPEPTPAPAVAERPAVAEPAAVAVAPPDPMATLPAPAPRPVAVVPPRFDADYLHNPPPTYPHLSRRLREQGRVLLRVRVSAEGLPGQIELHESSGHSRLDEAARESVGRWRFVPARQDGRSVPAWVLVPISYTLRS